LDLKRVGFSLSGELRRFHFSIFEELKRGQIRDDPSNFPGRRLFQSCYSRIVLELFSIIGALTLIFAVLIYDWWKYGRTRY